MRQKEDVLANPTVEDMINLFKQFPLDTPLRIDDPDTGWTINIIRSYEEGGVLFLTGNYHEMNG